MSMSDFRSIAGVAERAVRCTPMDVEERRWTRVEYERLVELENLPDRRLEVYRELVPTASHAMGGATAARRRSDRTSASRRLPSPTSAYAWPICCPEPTHSSGTGSGSTRPARSELSRARSFCSACTRRISGMSGRIVRKTMEISQKSSA